MTPIIGRIKVLLVNDSFHALDVMGKICHSDPMISVIATARNGIEALKSIEISKPDVVVMDLTMPYMDGPTTIRQIMQKKPVPILVCAPDDANQPSLALSCLSLGAVDAVLFNEKIDPMNLDAHLATLPTRIKLVSTIRAIRMLGGNIKDNFGTNALTGSMAVRPSPSKARSVLTIGASTGGPSALKFILSRLPERFQSAILIAQHMPENMTNELLKMLALSTRVGICEGRHGMNIEPGRIYIAPGGKNMVISDDRTIELTNASIYEHVPSVDTMMSSAAAAFRNNTVGLVLTGMGSDGKNGVVQIKSNGGMSFAQDQSTSVVFGMPKEAASTGTVDKVLPLDQIPLQLAKLIGVTENVA
ncbi:MAG: chemotaxis-specific protein-glutamate methyltransferase CheB [Caldisericia bacterium]|nr:chemotaxis-specific protein-glutamate methyltransferase CheB [Caldisericia bacterium]